MNCWHLRKRTGHYAWPCCSFSQSDHVAIILLVLGLVAPCILVVASTMIMVPIVSTTIVRSAIVTIVPVALVVVAIFVAMVLLVTRFRATCGRKMSRFLFLRLLLILGDLLKNASCLVGCLTLLKESNKLEWVSRHRLVQVRKLALMCLGLHKEDLFTLLLRRGYFHCLTEVATLEIAEELYLTPHELVHWHESRYLGRTKSADQLVPNIGEPGNGLKVVPDTLVEVRLHTICIVWASFHDDAGPFSQSYILKTLTH
jgi:hypothetical protein